MPSSRTGYSHTSFAMFSYPIGLNSWSKTTVYPSGAQLRLSRPESNVLPSSSSRRWTVSYVSRNHVSRVPGWIEMFAGWKLSSVTRIVTSFLMNVMPKSAFSYWSGTTYLPAIDPRPPV